MRWSCQLKQTSNMEKYTLRTTECIENVSRVSLNEIIDVWAQGKEKEW